MRALTRNRGAASWTHVEEAVERNHQRSSTSGAHAPADGESYTLEIFAEPLTVQPRSRGYFTTGSKHLMLVWMRKFDWLVWRSA
jgi:hypothetical protein